MNQIAVNLPVKDLDQSVKFFSELGFEFDPRFTDENATCMIVNEGAIVMLLKEEFFRTFTKKQIADASSQTEVIVSLSVDNRNDVDEFVNKAFDFGAQPSSDAIDYGFMYQWGFQDLDSHLWEVFYMEPEQLNS